VVPVLIAALIIVLVSFLIWWLWRRANRESMARGRTE
jgi:cbb3-type cytochrome oxidase subunit 3